MMPRLNVARHELKGSCDTLLWRIRESTAQDKAAESSSRRWGTAAVLLVLVTLPLLLSLTGRWATKHRHRRLKAAVQALGALTGLGGLFCGVKAWREKDFDLDDAKLAAVKRFLDIAKVDIPKDAPLAVDVDFRTYNNGGQVVGKEGGLFSSVKTYRYRHDWLSVSGSFIDGNRFRLAVTDRVTRKEKSKRKYTKVRESRRSRVRLLLSLKDRWGGAAGAAAVAKAGPEGPHRPRAVASRGNVVIADWMTAQCLTQTGRYGTTGKADNRVSGDDLLGSLVWTYAALHRARPQAS